MWSMWELLEGAQHGLVRQNWGLCSVLLQGLCPVAGPRMLCLGGAWDGTSDPLYVRV